MSFLLKKFLVLVLRLNIFSPLYYGSVGTKMFAQSRSNEEILERLRCCNQKIGRVQRTEQSYVACRDPFFSLLFGGRGEKPEAQPIRYSLSRSARSRGYSRPQACEVVLDQCSLDIRVEFF